MVELYQKRDESQHRAQWWGNKKRPAPSREPGVGASRSKSKSDDHSLFQGNVVETEKIARASVLRRLVLADRIAFDTWQ